MVARRSGTERRLRAWLFGVVVVGTAGIAWPVAASPPIEHWQTANGVRVYFVAAPEIPMVDLRVTFDAGSVRDGEQGGVAVMTNALLAEGAGELDADAIAERFAALGVSFGNDADRESSTVSLRTLSDPEVLEPALELVAMIVREPRFAAADLERERNRLLVGLQSERESPGAIASKAFFKALYGTHPYAAQPEGDETTVAALNRDDLVRFHRRYYVARNAQISIVGAVSREQAAAIAEQVVGRLPQGERAPALPPVPELTSAKVIRIEHPSQQSHIIMGQIGMRRGDPDYFALYVANQVLGGGGLVSRLNASIREQRGLAYSVYSYFAPLAQYGPFQMGLQTRNDQVDEALRVVRETLALYHANGPTAAELEAVKRNITGGFPLNIDNNRKIVGYLGMIGFYGLPLDYLERFPARIDALERETVHEAFRRRIDPRRMITVVVGGSATAQAKDAATQ